MLLARCDVSLTRKGDSFGQINPKPWYHMPEPATKVPWQEWKSNLKEATIQAHVGNKKFNMGKILFADGHVSNLKMEATFVSATVRGDPHDIVT